MPNVFDIFLSTLLYGLLPNGKHDLAEVSFFLLISGRNSTKKLLKRLGSPILRVVRGWEFTNIDAHGCCGCHGRARISRGCCGCARISTVGAIGAMGISRSVPSVRGDVFKEEVWPKSQVISTQLDTVPIHLNGFLRFLTAEGNQASRRGTNDKVWRHWCRSWGKKWHYLLLLHFVATFRNFLMRTEDHKTMISSY